MNIKNLTIAIDGPAGSGKSTAAKILAEKLDYIYVDTGAMYRAVAWKAFEEGISLNDKKAVGDLAEKIHIEFMKISGNKLIFVDGVDVTDIIRENQISDGASRVSLIKKVRDAMTAQQRKFGENGGVVMEGRDIGTVVFPDAHVKFFLEATPEKRAKRRFLELKAKKQPVSEQLILEGIILRDKRDKMREIAPLVAAFDAIKIDTTDLSVDELLDYMLQIVLR